MVTTVTDVFVLLGYLLLTDAVVLGAPNASPAVTALLALPLVFFLPGYAALSALFPADITERSKRAGRFEAEPVLRGPRLAWRTRAALSFGASLLLMPPVGLVLAVSGLGFESPTVVNALAFVVLVGLGVGVIRRMQLPEADRYQVPFREWITAFNDATAGAETRLDAGLNVALIVLAVAAVVGLAVAFVAPPSTAAYSEFYLMTENDQGNFVASGFPQLAVEGRETGLVVGIDNFEGESTTYTVVGELQRVQTEDGDVSVVDRQRVDRFQATVGQGETVRERRTFTPSMTGQDLRLTYYLYRGDAPADPTEESAYRTVFIWIDVTG